MGDTRRALATATPPLTLRILAGELGCHVNSASRAIHSGGRVCPEVHRRIAARLNIKPLI